MNLRALVASLAIATIAVCGFATAAQAGGDHGSNKPWICHPVNGKGETGTGWNLINPDHASSHIDESQYPDGVYWKHTSQDGRHDVYADGGTCPGGETEEPTPTPTETVTPSPTCETDESLCPTDEPTPTVTPTPTDEPTPTETVTPTPTGTPTSTPPVTDVPAPTPSLIPPTSTSAPIPRDDIVIHVDFKQHRRSVVRIETHKSGRVTKEVIKNVVETGF